MKYRILAPALLGLAVFALPSLAQDAQIKLPELPGGLDGAPAVVMTPELQKEAADKAAAVDKALAEAQVKREKAAAEKAAADKAAADKAAADQAAADKAAADKAAADKAAMEAAAAEKAAADKAAADKAAMEAAKPAPYAIQKGDNYWNLAGKFYGDKTMWPKIETANPGYKATDLTIGAPLEVPAK